MWNIVDGYKQSIRIGLTPLDEREAEEQLSRMAVPLFVEDARPVSAGIILRGYAEALLMVAASTVIGLVMAPRWGTSAVDLLYLPPVLGAAVLSGLRPALVAALASALCYNFFFTAPHHTFRIHNPADVVTVIILFLVAAVTSQLAASIRQQARVAAAHAARNATIAGLARRLLSCSTESQIAETACRLLSEIFRCNAILLSGQPPQVLAGFPAGCPLTPSDLAAAALVLETGEPAGRGAPRMDPADWQFHAVKSATAVLAAMGLARDDGVCPVQAEQRPLLENLLDQIALALERARLEAGMREVESLRERDRLRSALLSSVGHDLRTPLTAIIAAAAELRRRGPDDDGLCELVASESSKLERYISNLLDMARIEAGMVKLKAEPVDLVDSVSAALKDVRPNLEGRFVEVDLWPKLPLVRADPQLLHHCLINLLDNAGRYSDSSSAIRVTGEMDHGDVLLTIADEGAGVSHANGELVDMFTSISGSDRKGGAGLGLAIVKAFAEAMGATVTAANRPDRKGAALTIRFPARMTLDEMSAADAE